MKKIFIAFNMLLISALAVAQNDVDVLRYSQTQVGGTARSISLGGAVGALGADFASLNVNPAGIGLYKKSEFTVTPTFYGSFTNATMNNNMTTEFKDNFNLNNYGLVFAKQLNNQYGWKYFQFGIGVNRTNNFNNHYKIVNENHENSLMTDYQIKSYGKSPENLDPFSTDLAWYNWMLDTITDGLGNTAYTSPLSKGGVKQELNNITWGSTNEMNITAGSTFNDVFYIGGSIGFPFVRYFEQYEYKETDVADTLAFNFDKFILDKRLETSGSGVNFKMGVIFRPTGFLRIGLAYNSPTYLHLTDAYSSKMTRFYDSGEITSKSSPNGNFNYTITTPTKIIGSATITVNEQLLLTGDVEYINYGDGKLNSSDYGFFDENAEIRDKYKTAVNLRVGAEFRLNPLSFRVGFAENGSPYRPDINNFNYWIASAGLGYKNANYFFDLAFSYTKKSEDYYLYNPSLISATQLVYNNYRLAFTSGIKF